MKLKIDGCGGCGFCYLIWRQWFYGKGNDKAAARDVEIPESDRDEAMKAVRQCPAGAISIVEKTYNG